LHHLLGAAVGLPLHDAGRPLALPIDPFCLAGIALTRGLACGLITVPFNASRALITAVLDPRGTLRPGSRGNIPTVIPLHLRASIAATAVLRLSGHRRESQRCGKRRETAGAKKRLHVHSGTPASRIATKSGSGFMQEDVSDSCFPLSEPASYLNVHVVRAEHEQHARD
jgi:hypothetical protein